MLSLQTIINNYNAENLTISKSVILYGAGNFAQKCLQVLKAHGYEVLYVVDKEKYKKNITINSIPIVSMNDSRLTLEIKTKSSCVLGVFNAYVDLADIEKYILDNGFSHIINPMDFVDFFYDDMGDIFWLSSVKKLLAHSMSLLDSYERLEDAYSKELFKNIVKYRLHKSLKIVQKKQNVRTQYIPEDIPIEFPELNFIDCGAYDGDTIKHLLRNNIKIQSFVAFEPDLDNIKKLNENLKKHTDMKGFIYPCGVYSRSTSLSFHGGLGSASHVDEYGDVIVQVVSMDDVLLNYEVNFIKMDIEGSEIPALEGAKKLIKKYMPILAISAYHKFDDLWTVTDLLSSWNLDYSFYLRMYEYNGFELVYYAVPKKYYKENLP